MPVINYELMDFTMKYIETHPENHNQGNWFEGELNEQSGTHIADMNVCGSQGCFAGWASIFAGWHQVRPHIACIDCNESRTEAPEQCSDSFTGQHAYTMRHDLVVDETGRVMSMAEAARESLGLARRQADRMFAAGNSRRDLTDYVEILHENSSAML